MRGLKNIKLKKTTKIYSLILIFLIDISSKQRDEKYPSERRYHLYIIVNWAMLTF